MFDNLARKREACQRVNRMKRILKRGYITERLAECKGDAKRTWRILKELWPTKTNNTNITKIGDKTDSKGMADELNKHFISVGPKLSEKFDNNDINDEIINDPMTSFHFKEVEYQEVLKLLQQLSPSKACGVDGLTVHLIKACGDLIVGETGASCNILSFFLHNSATFTLTETLFLSRMSCHKVYKIQQYCDCEPINS